jgi:Rnl2 family RNA ligase
MATEPKKTFVEYHSIENPKQKFIEKICDHGYNEIEWFATEKVHGSNFSVMCNNTTGQSVISYCRRGDVLKENEPFFSWKNAMNKLKDNFDGLFKCLTEEKKSSIVQVYGELHGGIYPDMKSVGKMVQKGIYYSPDNEYIVFDILVDGQYMPFDEVVELTKKFKIPCVEVLHKGTLNELLKLSPVFESNIYKLYGLPKVENNYAEGYVFKPNKSLYIGMSRVIVKHKNPDFGEVKHPIKKVSVQDSKQTEEQTNLVTTAKCYITQNRMDSVVSKVGDGLKMDKLIGLLVKDAFADMVKDIPDAEKHRKLICSNMSKEAFKIFMKN